uniref:U3 small nucleolar RNA-associated protein 23 n=1 Tax=Kwoniella dejecticola CBS 10117 TaxID=1296121 RepID=A0A1A5ZV79_9TREE|nr:U3 small nucleolar RNA-associated protein 23 [Kwoniella dejecticola CBS 10117]OBR81708.1 U3 small nucleolar RNA-associated protein 23 [Kwoniella dejecticola CBS 10117]
MACEVSHDVLLESSKSDMDIVKVLKEVVQGEIKPMITQCCMEALYALGKDHQATTNVAKTFERRRCNHRTAIDGNDCLKDMIGQTNKHRYVLASQSLALRTTLETVPGLPIIHFNRTGVLVLSPPSTATIREKNKGEEEKRLQGLREMEGVVDGENVVAPSTTSGTGAGASSSQPIQGRRKVKGPNPLSMKKKKVRLPPPANPTNGKDNGEMGSGRKRSRPDQEGIMDDDDGDVGAVEGREGGEGKNKKKRRRKKKSVVAEAIAELNARNSGGESGSGSDGE